MQVVFNNLNTMPQQVDENADNIKILSADVAQNKADIAQNKADIGEWSNVSFTVDAGISGNINIRYNRVLGLLDMFFYSISGFANQGSKLITITEPLPYNNMQYSVIGTAVTNLNGAEVRVGADFTVAPENNVARVNIFVFNKPLWGAVDASQASLSATVKL